MRPRPTLLEMRRAQKDVTPPSYIEKEVAIVDEFPPQTSTQRVETFDRVRHFLAWCLLMEYRVKPLPSERLSNEDWKHFLQLSRLASLPDALTDDVAHMTDNASIEHLWEKFLHPAFLLGIPTDVAMMILRTFPLRPPSEDGHGLYPAFLPLLFGIDTLSAKLGYDYLLAKRVIDTVEARAEVKRRVEEVWRRYFSSKVIQGDNTLTRFGRFAAEFAAMGKVAPADVALPMWPRFERMALVRWQAAYVRSRLKSSMGKELRSCVKPHRPWDWFE